MFVLAFNNTTVNVPNNPINNTNNRVLRNSHTKYFLPRVNITNYNVLIDGRNFYDQPINDLVKQYEEIRKTATGQGEDYTTGCLLDYQYFKDHYQLIAVDLRKQEFRAIQYRKVNVKLSDRQLTTEKLKSVVKNKIGTTFRISLKMLDGNDLCHELLLTTRQKNEAPKCI